MKRKGAATPLFFFCCHGPDAGHAKRRLRALLLLSVLSHCAMRSEYLLRYYLRSELNRHQPILRSFPPKRGRLTMQTCWCRRLQRLLTLPLLLSLVACTTLIPLGNNSGQWASQLKPGDTVQLTRQDGSQHELTLTAVETDALLAGGQRIAFSDVRQLARKQMDGTRTTLLVVGLIAAAAAASGGGGGSGGGDY